MGFLYQWLWVRILHGVPKFRRTKCSDSYYVYSACMVRLRSITRLMMKKSKCVGIAWKKLSKPSPLRWHLPNVLRHIRPRWDNKLGGVFLFLLVDAMADKVQAKKDLEFCSAELSKYQNLSRSGLTLNEMRTIDGIMIKLKERINNLRTALYA